MATKKPSPAPLFQVGDRVKIRYWEHLPARIVEFRGPLGPGGTFVYRIRIAYKPKPSYAEIPEDELIAIPTPSKNADGDGR
jgi:hypothetical protein